MANIKHRFSGAVVLFFDDAIPIRAALADRVTDGPSPMRNGDWIVSVAGVGSVSILSIRPARARPVAQVAYEPAVASRLIDEARAAYREIAGKQTSQYFIGRKDAISCRAIPLADQLEAAGRRVRELEEVARRIVDEAKHPCPIGPCSSGCVLCDAERVARSGSLR